MSTHFRIAGGKMPYILSVLFCLTFVGATAANRAYYTAAVFEHARFGSRNDSASLIIETNLHYYRRAAEIAKSKGADVIVFPEYGIFPPGDRSQLKKFLEYIPDPTKEQINPCEETNNYKDRPIIYNLSCLAKKNSMVVVANTGDIQNCTGEDQCPSDGVFHFNTNVAFDRDGTMLVRYHKEHLFFELGMDLARKQQNSTFQTDFGTFATYICFDIDFPRMGEVGRWPGVDAILFSTMWLDMFPQFMSVQFWQSWALGNNVTLVAANIQIPGYFAVGSGMFDRREGAIAYTFNPDGISKLVVANVVKSGFQQSLVSPNSSITAVSLTDSWEVKDDGKDVPLECSRSLLNDSVDIYKDYRCLETKLDNYTFVKLTEPSGHLKACNNGMCCSLNYTTSEFGDESFYLGVFNGTYNSFDRYFWCEEDCVLARCDAHGGTPCGVFPLRSSTVFQEIHLRANFSTDIVYPQVVASGMRLVPLNDWHEHSNALYHNVVRDSDHYYENAVSGERCVHYENESGESLLSVGMKGRCYKRDPPYVR